MEYDEKEYYGLKQQLTEKLKKNLDDILFLELNKDILFKDTIEMNKEVPVPVRSQYLVDGIKSSEYTESIKLNDIVTSIIYVLGCDPEFKYNDSYINIIKNLDKKIYNVILKQALDYAGSGKYKDAFIYFTALNTICPGNKEIGYNASFTLKEWAIAAEKYSKNEFDLYYKLSFYEFIKLTEQYPDFSTAYYHLGFFYSGEGEREKAMSMWRKAYDLSEDDEKRIELLSIMESVEAESDFEEGKEFILEGNIIGGLRRLLPLVRKYDSWSEAKYFTALAYRKSGNFKKAEMLLNELLDAGEEFSELYNELGLCHYNLGCTQKAIEFLNNAVKIESDNAGYLCNLAIAYYSAGDVKKAKDYISRAYNINPQDEVTILCKKWADAIE